MQVDLIFDRIGTRYEITLSVRDEEILDSRFRRVKHHDFGQLHLARWEDDKALWNANISGNLHGKKVYICQDEFKTCKKKLREWAEKVFPKAQVYVHD